VNLIALCRGCNSRVNKNRDYWKSLFQDYMILREFYSIVRMPFNFAKWEVR